MNDAELIKHFKRLSQGPDLGLVKCCGKSGSLCKEATQCHYCMLLQQIQEPVNEGWHSWGENEAASLSLSEGNNICRPEKFSSQLAQNFV